MPYTHIGTPTRTRWSWVRHDTWHTGEVDRVWVRQRGRSRTPWSCPWIMMSCAPTAG